MLRELVNGMKIRCLARDVLHCQLQRVAIFILLWSSVRPSKTAVQGEQICMAATTWGSPFPTVATQGM